MVDNRQCGGQTSRVANDGCVDQLAASALELGSMSLLLEQKKKLEQLVTFALRQAIDAHGVAGESTRDAQVVAAGAMDAILADCADLSAQHALEPVAARLAVEAMLNDQPLPLVGKPLPQFV
jgi:hypothetical protein